MVAAMSVLPQAERAEAARAGCELDRWDMLISINPVRGIASGRFAGETVQVLLTHCAYAVVNMAMRSAAQQQLEGSCEPGDWSSVSEVRMGALSFLP